MSTCYSHATSDLRLKGTNSKLLLRSPSLRPYSEYGYYESSMVPTFMSHK